jgi:hypothetical protein
MKDAQQNKAIDEWAILQSVRSNVRQLCQSPDSLLQPQYCHLLARVEALIELIGPKHFD